MSRIKDKKILLLVTQTKYGGVQKYILQLARYFRNANNVKIAVGEANNLDNTFLEESRSIGIEPIVLNNMIRDVSLVKAFDAAREIRTLLKKEKPDILHINSSMAGVLGSAAAWVYGFDPLNKRITVIYTVHGFVFNEPLTPLKRRVYLTAEKISAAWKSAFITVSDFDREQGIRRKIDKGRKMITIHNGTDLNQRFLDRNEARHALSIPSGSKQVIGTIASFYRTKGLEYLAQAMARLTKKSDIHCYIIGDGPERKTLEFLINDLALGENMTLLGAKKNGAQYLKAFDVFVLPSVKEGMPLTILEAGLAGVPVVATKVGGVPEIVDNKTNGLLVESQNPENLAIAIRHSLDNPDEASTFANNLKKKIQQDFSLDKMLDKTDELYARLHGKN